MHVHIRRCRRPRALSKYPRSSQVHMGTRMIRDRKQGFGQLRFGRGERCNGIAHKQICSADNVCGRRSNERLRIAGINGQREIEKAARSHNIFRVQALIEPSQTLKVEVHRVQFRACSARRASAAMSSVFSAPASRETISSCMSNRSARGLSKRSAQRWLPVSASMSCTLTRTRFPPRWTLPSRQYRTFNSRPMVFTSSGLPL